MNRVLLQKAQSVIDARRQYAEKVAQDFLKTALNNQDFAELYKRQKELEIELTRKEVYGEKVDYGVIDDIKRKQEFLLKEIGLNGTDLLPNYECRLCNDTGYVDGLACECLKREVNKELFAYSGFNTELHTFDEKHIDHPAFKLMKKWCETQNNKYIILICGPTGTGKTYLTQCVADKLMKQNRIVLFTSAFNLHNSMLNYHINQTAGRDQILEPFLSAEVLIIDDLGSEPMLQNVTKEYLYLIISERLENKLPTIITSNLYPDEILNHYSSRLSSRLTDKQNSILINLDGDDLRSRMYS